MVQTLYGDIFTKVREFEETIRKSKKEFMTNNTEALRQKLHQMNATYIRYLKLEENILKQLQSNYQSIGTVAFTKSTKTYTITPTNKKYVKSLKTIKSYPSQNQKAITTITSNFKSLSKSLKKNLAAGYTIQLLQPDTTDKTLLSVKDGQIITNNFK